MLSLLISGIIFINYNVYAVEILSGTNSELIIFANVIVLIGFGIVGREMIAMCSLRRKKKELEEAKKTRHEYRRHIQNVQALLYIEAYDEANDYALSLEQELKSI